MVPVHGRGASLRAHARRLFAALTVASALVVAPVIHADPPVAVGEVSTVVGNEDATKTIRSTLAEELAKVKAPAGKKFIVSATLVKLETKTAGGDATTSAVVSLAVRDAKDGAIRGVVNGSGAVVAHAGDATATKSVVEAAVRGATKSLPIVLAKAQ